MKVSRGKDQPKTIGDIKLYSILELSQILNVTVVTLRKYIKNGKLKGQKIGVRFFVTDKSLNEFFDGENNKQ